MAAISGSAVPQLLPRPPLTSEDEPASRPQQYTSSSTAPMGQWHVLTLPEGHATEEHASKHRDHGRTREKEQERDRKKGWERKWVCEHNREKRQRSKREDDKHNWKRDRRDWWQHSQWDMWTFCNNSVLKMLWRLGSVLCNLCKRHWHKCNKKAGNETLACPGCMHWTRNKASINEQTGSDYLCGRDVQSLTMQVSERACWFFGMEQINSETRAFLFETDNTTSK